MPGASGGTALHCSAGRGYADTPPHQTSQLPDLGITSDSRLRLCRPLVLATTFPTQKGLLVGD